MDHQQGAAPTPMTTGRALRIVSQRYRATLVDVVGDVPQGVRGYLALTEAARIAHPSQLALATALGIDRTVLVYLLDELETAGLVERRPNPGDRRQRVIRLTEDGTRVLARAQDRVGRAETRLLAALDPSERDQLHRLLTRVADDLTPVPDACAGESPADC